MPLMLPQREGAAPQHAVIVQQRSHLISAFPALARWQTLAPLPSPPAHRLPVESRPAAVKAAERAERLDTTCPWCERARSGLVAVRKHLSCCVRWRRCGRSCSRTRAPSSPGSRVPRSSAKVAPDEVELMLSIETFDATLAKAKQDNDLKIKTVLESLKSHKLDARSIQTDAIVIEPHYWNRNSSDNPAPPKLTHYTVRRNVIVALKDVSKFETILAAALESGANYVQDITFKSSALRKHRDQARSMAIRAAKEKATALAGELGMKVGKPFTITENGGNYFPTYRSSGRGNALMNAQISVASDVPAAEVVQGTFAPGQISIEANVSVVFELQ
ncbi:MAG TPA: SIMPL domain-containing protein [Candidatus Acidoferrum sp.]|nr:SIMPL domain-containing protein [Candidatus Acidoferrum sp.]